MTTTENPHTWFCEECRKKGYMFANDTIDKTTAMLEHRTSSPTCKGDIRIVPEAEAERDPEIRRYKDWAD